MLFQGGSLISQDHFFALKVDQHFTWHDGGQSTSYDVRFNRSDCFIAVHATSTACRQVLDSIHTPSDVAAIRMLAHSAEFFECMLQLKEAAALHDFVSLENKTQDCIPSRCWGSKEYR
jgi:hypothetical protein